MVDFESVVGNQCSSNCSVTAAAGDVITPTSTVMDSHTSRETHVHTSSTTSSQVPSTHTHADVAPASPEAETLEYTEQAHQMLSSTAPALENAATAVHANTAAVAAVARDLFGAGSMDGAYAGPGTPLGAESTEPCHIATQPDHTTATAAISTATTSTSGAAGPQHPDIDSMLAETPRKYMHVWVKTTMSSQPTSVRVRYTDTLARIKVKVLGKTNVPVHMQQLLHGDTVLGGGRDDDSLTAVDLGITEGSVLTLVPRLHSGPLRARTPELAPAEAASVTQQMLLNTIASRVPLPELRQQLLDHGKPVHFVARVNGRFALVRLHAQPGATDAEAADALSTHGTSLGPQPTSDPSAETTLPPPPCAYKSKVQDVLGRLKDRRAARELRNKRQPSTTTSPLTMATASALAAGGHYTTPEPSRPRAPVVSVSGDSQSRPPRRPRCNSCRAKVPLVHHACRCGDVYCGAHRFTHSCSHNFKGM